MRTRLDRLMKKQEDGSYKVVGFEWHVDGKTWRTKKSHGTVYLGEVYWCCIEENTKETPLAFYIPHDRIDEYTGITLDDGTKVFERDRFLNFVTKTWYVVEYNDGGYVLSREGADSPPYVLGVDVLEIDNVHDLMPVNSPA